MKIYRLKLVNLTDHKSSRAILPMLGDIPCHVRGGTLRWIIDLDYYTPYSRSDRGTLPDVYRRYGVLWCTLDVYEFYTECRIQQKGEVDDRYKEVQDTDLLRFAVVSANPRNQVARTGLSQQRQPYEACLGRERRRGLGHEGYRDQH